MKKYTIEQFINTENVMGNSISFDGETILYGSDKSGVFNAYTKSRHGGEAQQVTHSEDDAVFPISFFPNDNRFLYASDKGGNEITHLYVRNEDGSVRDLTPEANEKAEFYCWSQDEKSFFYGSNKRDPKYMDVYEMDIHTLASSLVFKNADGYQFAAVSGNKKYVAFSKPVTANESNMFLYDHETGEVHLLSENEGECQYLPQAFDSQSNSLFYLTDEAEEFLSLKKYNIASGTSELVQHEEWDITFAQFSPDHRYLVTGINRDAKTEVKIWDTTTGMLVDLSDLPEGQIQNVKFSRNEQQMSFLLNSSTSPSNLYIFDLNVQQTHRLTDTLNPEINPADLVQAEIVRFASFDGLDIPAIFYKPQIISDQKHPALVFVHGGPGGQSTVNYNPIFQYLVNHGFAVLAVNNRGSSGYGKTFFKAADLKHGEVDLADCVEAKKFLQSTEFVDENRIGIIGGSYGGFMVLAALAFRPDEFAVGVDIFGVSNWERTLKSIPSWWEAIRELLYKKLGNPYTDDEYIRSISPLFHADNIVKPLIVLQGANDPRVLQVESDEIVEAVRNNGVPVEYIVFEDEGHGFTKKVNQIKGYKAIHEFLERYL